MGTIGHKIFQDDFALDVRERYLDMLYNGTPNEKATNELITEHMNDDEDEMPVFWLSLAATQWEYGRLMEIVKQKALSLIDSGVDQENWNGNKKRIKELDKLKSKLLTPQLKEKRLVQRRIKTQPGDVFVFKIDDDHYAFGRVLKPIYIAIYQFKSKSNKLPIEEIIQNKIAFVIGTTEDGFYNRKWKIIGNSPLEQFFTNPIYFFHIAIESDECRVFNIWLDHEYNIIKETECQKMQWGPFGIEQWSPHSSESIIKRLTDKLNGTPYNKGLLPENWESLHYRKMYNRRSDLKNLKGNP
jgi:hypothetical protein